MSSDTIPTDTEVPSTEAPTTTAPAPTTTWSEPTCLDINQNPVYCYEVDPCLASPTVECGTTCLDIQHHQIPCSEQVACEASPIVPCESTTTTAVAVGVPPSLPSTGAGGIAIGLGVGTLLIVAGVALTRWHRPKVRSTMHPSMRPACDCGDPSNCVRG